MKLYLTLDYIEEHPEGPAAVPRLRGPRRGVEVDVAGLHGSEDCPQTQPHPRACRCAGCCYDAVVDAALPSGLPRATYLDLAILALDEYGVSAELQTRIRNEIEDVIAGGDR